RVRLAPGETRMAEIALPVPALACWDVDTHRMIVPPGDYEVFAGASSADVRQSATLTVRGPAPAPRQLLGRAVAAADFDDYGDITLVDATRETGDAVAPDDPGRPGWIVFRDVDLDGGPARPEPAAPAGPGGYSVTARVARAQPGDAWLEFWHAGQGSDGPGEGTLLGRVAVPSTGGRYTWTEVTAGLAPAAGVGDLYLVLRGAQRLASFRIRR
ncbi:MAG TPA: fibronectin type III-like domain-contianing protein, partial [Streptosporangiaceae bacterium]|nr:fibronectin type III-like domain-contianing protein [Streptosporangiaceae bacterium]